jgi:hypothetical protein
MPFEVSPSGNAKCGGKKEFFKLHFSSSKSLGIYFSI